MTTARPLYVGERLVSHGRTIEIERIETSKKANRIADALQTIAAFPENTPLKVVGPVWNVYNPSGPPPFSAQKLPPALTRPDTVVTDAVFHNFVDMDQPAFNTFQSVAANNVVGLQRIRALNPSPQLGVVFMLHFGDDLNVLAIYHAEDITVYSPSASKLANAAVQAVSARTNYTIASSVSALTGHGSRSNALGRLTYRDFGWEAPAPLPPLPPFVVDGGGGAKRRVLTHRRRGRGSGGGAVRTTTSRRRRAAVRAR